MKFLKYFLILVVVLLIGGYFYVSSIPADYDVSRTKTIKAPVSKVFNTVNDLKTWEKWGPWHDEDSTIVITYGQKTVGVGASDSWTSKDGPGSMETINVVQNILIEQKLRFADGDPSDIIWSFQETDNGTKVTWRMKQKGTPFMFRAFAKVLGGWDQFFGPMEEKGLNNLANIIAKMPDSYRLSKVSSINLPAQKFIGYPVKMIINHEEMTRAFMDKMPKVETYAAKRGLKAGDFLPAAVYTKYDEQTQETEFYIGVVVKKNVLPAEGMNQLDLNSGKAIKISKFGSYGNGDYEAHMTIASYLSENKMEQSFPIWETYPNNPSKVKPIEVQTDIYYPVK